MKNVRIWFKKDFECRYISHLDLNRCMLRALHKSKIPVWHTEGFNPHPFATFPLPLSLGFRGVNECMDIKLEEDNYAIIEVSFTPPDSNRNIVAYKPIAIKTKEAQSGQSRCVSMSGAH